MSKDSGLGFSSAQAMSSSVSTWKGRLSKFAIFLVILIVVGLFFMYISGATRQIGGHEAKPADSTSDVTHSIE